MAARHHAMRTLILLAAMAVTSDAQTVNSAAVARRRAKKDAENEFLETHGASFGTPPPATTTTTARSRRRSPPSLPPHRHHLTTVPPPRQTRTVA